MLVSKVQMPTIGYLAKATKKSCILGPHIRRLATVQVNTPRQMPINGKKRETDISNEISNFTIRVREAHC